MSISPEHWRSGPPAGVESDAFGDYVRTLRLLIDQADASTARLGALLDRTEKSGGTATQASMRIQERLRLGAHMLKAFQAQIERVEDAIADLHRQHRAAEVAAERVEEQLSRLHDRLGGLSRDTQHRLEDVTRMAVARMERQFTNRVAELIRIEQRVASLTADAERA